MAFAVEKIKSVLSSSPKSRKQLLYLTGIPERTLRYKLAILKEEDLIEEIISFSDLRRKRFSLKR